MLQTKCTCKCNVITSEPEESGEKQSQKTTDGFNENSDENAESFPNSY